MVKKSKTLSLTPQFIKAIDDIRGAVSFSAFLENLGRSALLRKHGIRVPLDQEQISDV